MGIGDEEGSSSKELRLSIDSQGIYREMAQNYSVWKGSDTKESLGNLGVNDNIELSGGVFNFAHFSIGTGFIHDGNRDKTPKTETHTTLYFGDNISDREDKGYIDDEKAKNLQKLLVDQGFESITFTSGEYNRSFRFNLGGKIYRLEIGDPNLEANVKRWKDYKIGDEPTKNNSFSLHMISDSHEAEPENGLPFSEKEFAENSDSLLEATKRVIWASDEYFGTGRTTSDTHFESHLNQREKQHKKLGFSVTDYDEGEFESDGSPGERVYAEIDNLNWRKHQDRITEWRGLANRQVLTMSKDKLVFGRWGGKSASDSGSQADVLIDEDMDPEEHKIMKEMGISRRHFTLSFDPNLTKALEETTGGIIKDGVVLEDLFSTNSTYLFRSSDEAITLFGPGETLPKGGKAIVLPGDLILVGGGEKDSAHKLEDWINNKTRGIGLVYLGERKFVKVNIGAIGSEATEDILAVVRPQMIDSYREHRRGLLEGREESLLSGEPLTDEAIAQALKVVENYDLKVKLQVGYSEDEIGKMEINDLLDLIGNVDVDQEKTLDHALTAVAQRQEPEVVGYALLSAIRIGGFDETAHLLAKSDLWKKLPSNQVLPILDYIERADITDEQKDRFLNIAYTSRDDSVKLLIRKRIQRYIGKGITSHY